MRKKYINNYSPMDTEFSIFGSSRFNADYKFYSSLLNVHKKSNIFIQVFFLLFLQFISSINNPAPSDHESSDKKAF